MTSHHLLVGVDGSANAASAVQWAADHAPTMRATVTVIYCFEPPIPLLPTAGSTGPFDDPWRAQVSKLLEEEWCAPLRDAKVNYSTRIDLGEPASTICEVAAREGFDLIVVGRRGRNPLTELVLGSVSHRISRHAPCPVVVVPNVLTPTPPGR
ncbi:MAG: universal stress protein [Acidimicrobiia bacterium]